MTDRGIPALLLGLVVFWLAAGPACAGRLGFGCRDGPDGVVVTRVEPGSPAASAGMTVGDLVRGAQDTPVSDAAELAQRLGNAQDRVSLTLERDGWRRRIELRVRPAPAGPRLGLKLVDAADGQGARIVEVVPGSPAAAAGLAAGDVVVALDDAAVGSAAELAGRVRSRQAAAALRIDLRRDGWRRSVTLSPALPTQVRVAPTSPASLPAAVATGDSPDARPDGLRAAVTVGDFQVKAAKATPYIGDGLREMLLTALHRSGYFIVVERMDIQGIAAEQALSRSALAAPGDALPGAAMDVAEVMIYGVVSEFEPEARGLAFTNFIPRAGIAISQSSKVSEMAIDVRAVDVASGRVLVARTIPGSAQSFAGGISGGIPVGGMSMPVSLAGYRNTPMEWAIRDCIEKATYFVVNNIPRRYYRHH